MKYCIAVLFLGLFLPQLTCAQGLPISTPTGLWEFNNSGNIYQATVGSNLSLAGTAPSHAAALSDGSTSLSGVVTTVTGTANRLIMPNPTGGNGGGSYTNEYTLLYDIFSPAASRSAWRCLLQTNTGNGNDGDYFIRNSDDKIGVSGLGYSTNAISDSVWTRLVLVFDINATGSTSTVRAYVNGSLFHTHSISGGRDGTYGLEGSALLFADNNAENASLHVGAVGFWGKILSAAEIAALGSAGAPIQGATLPNQAPVITQGDSTTLTAGANTPAPLTLNATDGDGNTLSWSVSGQATHGSAAVTSSSSGQATITYTPSTNYIGPDTFTVQVSDSQATDAIQVNVNVQGSVVIITQGATISMAVPTNSSAQPLSLNATDSAGTPLVWSISSPAQNGSAVISGNNNTTGVISYTPTAGYIGADSFTVQASNGSTFDEIVVSVQVAYASGSNKTFYTQNFNAAALLAEQTTSSERRMASGDNTPVWNTPQGAGLNLSSGANVYLNPVDDRIVEFTGFNLMRSDFWSNADDQGRSTAFARGANVIAVADSDEYSDGSGTGGGGTEAEFNVYLRTPPILIPSGATVSPMTLTFLSAFRVEEDETAKVKVYHNGNSTPAAVLDVPNIGAAAAAPVTFTWAQLGSPASGSVIMLEFAHEDADNNWWWAFDDISLGIPNQIPVITEGESIALNAQLNSPSQITVNATDGDGDTINWDISTAATHGNAVVTSSNSTQATVTYTPAPNYAGPDSFTIRASDGGSSDTIVVSVAVVNGAPDINEGENYSLNATKNGGARTVTFTAIDPNGNPLNWSITTPAAHGVAQITDNSNTEAVVSYTPATDYSGPDSFVVSVTDGALTDSITVNVTVTDPVANPKLTIVSAYGTATPVPGVYEHPRGTSLTNSVTDEVGATTRHVCTGWTMTGDGPASGTASTMNMTLTRDSVLTWNFRTEHRVEVTTLGSGSVSSSSGWYEAGKPLQLTAIPAAGQYFVGWTGDISGCQTGGKNIVIPMDRARSVITATFAVNENFTVIALPDTQNYTSISSPSDLYTRQTQWIVNNKNTMNIKFVTHLGDIVNSPSSQSQWLRATDAMNLMNNQLPYGTCPGNHDINSGSDTNYLIRFGPNPTHSSSINRWIDPDNSQTYDWYRGASPRGYSSYQIVRVNGRDYGFLHLDLDCPDPDIAWAAGVLAAHPKTLIMVTTHNYLAETGGSGTYGSGTGQRGYTAQATPGFGSDRNRPLDIFNSLVKPFNQVYLVICGHNFATYNLVKTNDAGKNVHEVLVDWQSLPNGGNGFLRIMEYRPQQNQIYNTSFSPYLGRYVDPNNSADHQGMLDLHDRYGSEFALTTDFETRFNSTLTVVSAFGGVSPAVGSHSIETGTPIAISAQEQVTGQTRYRPVGWNLTGGQTASGTGSSAVITQGANATLTWSYATEHYLTTGSTGSGIVSTNSGWYTAGSVVNLQAQPDAGASFLQWTGDIAGCTINGTTISVPMTRPRGPITAQFSSPLSTYNVEIVSAFPDVNPAPATYPYEQGQTVTFSATDVLGADTRRLCTGYSVTGAVTQSGSGKSFELTITGDIVVTWHWKTQYLLTTALNGPGSTSPGATTWVDEDAATAVVASPNTGAVFTGWTGDTGIGNAVGSQFNIPAMTRPVGPLTANFTVANYTLTVVSSQTTTTPASGTYTYAHGTTVEFSAVSAEVNGSRQRPSAWALTGAITQNGTEPKGSFIMTGDTTLTWTFTPEVLLRITSGGEGNVLPMASAGWHALGSPLSLQAVAAEGFELRQWTGDVPPGSTNATLGLIMDQPRMITADFKPVTTSDGTPHWWLAQNTTVTAANYEAASINDIDQDGFTAGKEFLAGTSDLDGADRPQILSVVTSGDGMQFIFTISAREGRVYQLLQGTSFGSAYAPVGSPVLGTPPSVTISVPKQAGAGPFYFSVQAALQAGSAQDPDALSAAHLPKTGSVLRAVNEIPAGAFTQGEESGPSTTRPEHTTKLLAFGMDKFEVTRAEWEAIATWAQSHGYDIPVTLRYNQAPYDVPADHPAVAVSWYDAVKWCNARSEMEGRRPVYYTDSTASTVFRAGQMDLTADNVNWAGDGYRLPTDAEWERASRGGIEGAPYAWGSDTADLRANHWDYQVLKGRAPNQPYPYTERVGYFDGTQFGGAPDMANGFGLYDMAGNAWEWTWDRMGDYSGDTQYDPYGPDTGGQRVQRGGSWWNYIDQATNHQRLPFPPDGSDDYGMIGFRCVRGLHPNELQDSGTQITGLAVVSAPVSIGSGTSPTVPPQVTLTSPASGAVVVLPSQIQFEATASDSDGTVAKVEFLVNGTKVGEDIDAPYTFGWAAISGTYTLQAIAEDNAGARAATQVVAITVTNPGNSMPAVAIVSPTSGARVNATLTTITATASDLDGVISKVEFFNGSTKLGEDTEEPFEFSWSGIANGQHALTAVATDNDGGSTISATVNVSVVRPVLAITKPLANATLTEVTAGVTVEGTLGTAGAGDPAIASVSVSVNGGTAQAATISADKKKFSLAGLRPPGGANTLSVTATNAEGNSTTAALGFTYVTLRPITVTAVNGAVKFNPALGAGGKAQVGKTYEVTATPAKGFFFQNWGGKTTGASATTSFVFAEGDTVVANFQASPFTDAVSGMYVGLVKGIAAADTQANSGLLTLTLAKDTGAFTGKVVMDGASAPIAGVFHHVTRQFSSKAVTNGFVTNLTLDIPNNRITGTIDKMKRGASAAQLDVSLAQAHSKTHLPGAAQAGSYNLAIRPPVAPDEMSQDEYPRGSGYAQLTISGTDGVAKAAGILADGTAFTSATWLCRDSTVPMYATFAARTGALRGMLTLADLLSTDVTGNGFHWFRSQNNGQFYPWGYGPGLATDVVGAKTSTSTLAALNLNATSPNAQINLTNGLFSVTISKLLTFSSAGVGIPSNTSDKLTKLTITTTGAKLGVITGSHMQGTSKFVINGIIVGKGGSGQAHGHVLSPVSVHTTGEGQGGSMTLTPVP